MSQVTLRLYLDEKKALLRAARFVRNQTASQETLTAFGFNAQVWESLCRAQDKLEQNLKGHI